jgi:GDP-L-fucose synthase
VEKRILVTGGNGFLGRQVVRRLSDSQIFAPRSSELNLLQLPALEQFLISHQIDAIIHCAGFVGGIGLNKRHPGRMITDNLRMGLNVLEAAARFTHAQVVIVSTICVYPSHAPIPTSESMIFEGAPAEETGFYGIAKRTLLTVSEGLSREFGLAYSYLIPTNLYGPDDYDDEDRSHVVSALLKRVLEAKRNNIPEVVVWGDGMATRDLVYVEDAADAVIACMRPEARSQVYNFGSGREISIRELAETICDVVGYEGRLSFDSTKPSGALRRALDSTKIKEQLGVVAKVNLREGLKRSLEFAQKEHRVPA